VTALQEAHIDGGFEALYLAHQVRCIRLATVIIGDRSIAEEIVQDAFIEVSRRWENLDNPAGYLRTAVVNRCRNHLRRLEVSRRKAPPPPRLEVDAPELDELWTVLFRLPPRRRAALVLRYYEDLTVPEIARVLGCRPGTVSSLLHRGLADLREVLDHAG